MFDGILNNLNIFGSEPANDIIQTRRKDMRRDGMQVEVVIGRRAYPVHDWSRAGVSFDTPNHEWNSGHVYYEDTFVPNLKVGDDVKLTMRFSVLQGAIEVPVDARIVRVAGGRTMAEIKTLNKTAGRKFDFVIDSLNAQRFLESQAEQIMHGGRYDQF